MPRRDDDRRSPNIHNIKELVVPPPEPPLAYQDAREIGPKSHLYTLHMHTHTIYIILYTHVDPQSLLSRTHMSRKIYIFFLLVDAHILSHIAVIIISVVYYTSTTRSRIIILYKNDRHHCCVMRTVILCVHDRATVFVRRCDRLILAWERYFQFPIPLHCTLA